MKLTLLSIAVTSAIFSPAVLAENNSTDLPSMLVSADFRPAQAQDIPVSLTTFDEEIIETRGAQHISDLLNLAPNVNLSSGGSRGHFFQIRGMGERSEYTSPINRSVGLYIDGIDFSQIGGAGTLFDVETVDVLRGPQGTLYGANALAGVINMQSKQATNEFDMKLESTAGNYGTRSLGVAVGGPIVKDQLLGRIAVHQHRSDGYMENDYLDRDNTHNFDELTARGHLKWLVHRDLTIDLNLLHINTDNGYDAFTMDNSRHTLSDQPGEDKQRTNAFALKTDWRVNNKVQLQSSLSYSKSDLTYGFDGDWLHVGSYKTAEIQYQDFEHYDRQRENYALEFRAMSNEYGRIFANSTDWSFGIYHADQRQTVDSVTRYWGDTSLLANRYDTKNTAIFGQLDTSLTDKLTLISGLRAEYWQADFEDSQGIELDNSDMLFGGKLGLTYQWRPEHMFYTTLSRGFKSGGMNDEPDIDPRLLKFQNEYMWNLDVGIKSIWLDGSLMTELNAFYGWRKDAQVRSSAPNTSQPGKWKEYTENAAKGRNMGIEASIDWLVNDHVRTFASLGLLRAVFDEYDNPALEPRDMNEGRRQAHAPAYTFAVGSEVYLSPNWTLRANVEGKDEFYYSNSHMAKSSSYALTNASLQYHEQNWTVTFWGRNLFDKEYATRGFFFGNDPSIGYVDRNYTQLGAPRTFGVTVSYDY